MVTRGVIVSCRMRAGPEPSLHIQAMPLEDLRRYVLYWDKIVGARPRVRGGNFGWAGFTRPDFQFLASAGIFQEIDVDLDDVSALKTNDVLPLAQMRLAKSLSDQGRLLWSVAQVGETLTLPTQEKNIAELVEIDLYNSLPVPIDTTPLDRILEFKEKRKSELLTLRHALDNLYEKVANADDKVRARIGAIEQLDIALTDLHRTIRLSRIESLLTNLSMYVSLKESPAIGAVLGAIGAAQLGVPVAMGALAGIGLNAAITFASTRLQDKITLPDSSRDFAYVYRASKSIRMAPTKAPAPAPILKPSFTRDIASTVFTFPARLNDTACPACGVPYSYTTFSWQIRRAFPTPGPLEILKINCSECGTVSSWLYRGEWDEN